MAEKRGVLVKFGFGTRMPGSSWHDLVKKGHLIKPEHPNVNVFLTFQLTQQRADTVKEARALLKANKIAKYGLNCNGRLIISVKAGESPNSVFPVTRENLFAEILRIKNRKRKEPPSPAGSLPPPKDPKTSTE